METRFTYVPAFLIFTFNMRPPFRRVSRAPSSAFLRFSDGLLDPKRSSVTYSCYVKSS